MQIFFSCTKTHTGEMGKTEDLFPGMKSTGFHLELSLLLGSK